MVYKNIKDFDKYCLYVIEPLKRKQGLRKKGNNKTYKNAICAFDIETSRLIPNSDISIMYIWQFCIDDKYLIWGRTWDEFRILTEYLQEASKGDTWMIFVHNLSYEFQYLRGIFDFRTEDVFAVKSRKVLKCDALGCLEFRCSYLQTNMSLELFCKKMKVQHGKKVGQLDYAEIRYPWTPLTAEEFEYCFDDVIGLCEALKVEMESDSDSLYTIPLTSTGYVRRDAKNAMLHTRKGFVKEMLPDYSLYKRLREAFRGGNCHANRFYVGRTIKDVSSADRSSSYPDVVCNCKFPMSYFRKLPQVRTSEQVENIINQDYACLITFIATNVELINNHEPAPYIPLAKCNDIGPYAIDNGRILSTDYLEMTVTDVDYKILKRQYKWKTFEVTDFYYTSYDYLPSSIIEMTIKYYKNKTELKDVDGQEMLYMKSKNKLNSIYGMMAQDPAKLHYLFDFNTEKGYKDFIKNTNQEEEFEKFTSKAFLAYQWGVWVTAWARYRLQEGIDLAGLNFIYADTDSVKYIGNIDWNFYNTQRIFDSFNSGAYAKDPKGNMHYMGVYEFEGKYPQFRTMGAKKYVYTDSKTGKLHCTVSGVTKESVYITMKDGTNKRLKMGGGEELEKYNGIESFKDGFIFNEAGGSEICYTDYIEPDKRFYEIDGHIVEITPCATIKDSTYKLGYAADYDRLLKQIANEIEDDECVF